MKHFTVSFLFISVFFVLVAGRARDSPIKFQSETQEADNEGSFNLEPEDENQGSAKSKHSVGAKENSFRIKVKQQKETKSKSGVMKVIKITETEKVDGGNVTSTSFEVIHYPNGTKVIKGKPPKGKLCSNDKDCGAGKHCSFGRCQNCTKEGGFCMQNSECCHGDSGVCSVGLLSVCKRVDRSGKNGSYCTRDSECKETLCCVRSLFGPGVCRPFGREGEQCGESMFGMMRSCPCMEGLSCGVKSWPFFGRICKKKGKEKQKEVMSDAESGYDFFDDE